MFPPGARERFIERAESTFERLDSSIRILSEPRSGAEKAPEFVGVPAIEKIDQRIGLGVAANDRWFVGLGRRRAAHERFEFFQGAGIVAEIAEAKIIDRRWVDGSGLNRGLQETRQSLAQPERNINVALENSGVEKDLMRALVGDDRLLHPAQQVLALGTKRLDWGAVGTPFDSAKFTINGLDRGKTIKAAQHGHVGVGQVKARDPVRSATDLLQDSLEIVQAIEENDLKFLHRFVCGEDEFASEPLCSIEGCV